MPPQQQCPRGPFNSLHQAARDGTTELALAVLSSDDYFDPDEGTPEGMTPLMFAAMNDHTHMARILLDVGADASMAGAEGFTPLHLSALQGHLAVTKLLMKAGADLTATDFLGATPLHGAVRKGHPEAVSLLIEAGANLNSRRRDGGTPLYCAARYGCVDALKVLLRARADPVLTWVHRDTGATFVPLVTAAENGHLEAVRVLIQQLGIEGCGGAREGETALQFAAQEGHLDIMRLLTDAGVVDVGGPLVMAAEQRQEEAVKFLLRQRGTSAALTASVNSCGPCGEMALLSAIRAIAGRVVRLLVDAGANTTSAVRQTNAAGFVTFDGTPLAFTSHMLRQIKKVRGEGTVEEQLHGLEAIRRLLLRVEAVHAISWLWPRDVASPAAAKISGRKKTITSPLLSMLPVLRRRARRRDVVLAALFRRSRSLGTDAPSPS